MKRSATSVMASAIVVTATALSATKILMSNNHNGIKEIRNKTRGVGNYNSGVNYIFSVSNTNTGERITTNRLQTKTAIVAFAQAMVASVTETFLVCYSISSWTKEGGS